MKLSDRSLSRSTKQLLAPGDAGIVGGRCKEDVRPEPAPAGRGMSSSSLHATHPAQLLADGEGLRDLHLATRASLPPAVPQKGISLCRSQAFLLRTHFGAKHRKLPSGLLSTSTACKKYYNHEATVYRGVIFNLFFQDPISTYIKKLVYRDGHTGFPLLLTILVFQASRMPPRTASTTQSWCGCFFPPNARIQLHFIH